MTHADTGHGILYSGLQALIQKAMVSCRMTHADTGHGILYSGLQALIQKAMVSCKETHADSKGTIFVFIWLLKTFPSARLEAVGVQLG